MTEVQIAFESFSEANLSLVRKIKFIKYSFFICIEFLMNGKDECRTILPHIVKKFLVLELSDMRLLTAEVI